MPEISTEEISFRIHDILKRKSLNLKDLSGIIDVNYRTLVQYFDGTRVDYPTQLLLKISNGLEIDISVLFSNEPIDDQYPAYIPWVNDCVDGISNKAASSDRCYVSTKYFSANNLNKNEVCAFEVGDDSMAPEFNENDVLLVDLSDTTPANGKPFLIKVDDEVMVKLLQRGPGGVMASSRNNVYESFSINDDNIEVLGKVKSLISRKVS